MVASFSATLKNMKFMKNKKSDPVEKGEKTLSYYACKSIIHSFSGEKKGPTERGGAAAIGKRKFC